MNYEMEGTIIRVDDVAQINDSFKKRLFVIEAVDGKYKLPVQFELMQDKVDLIQPKHKGEAVKVSFNIRGREWKDRYFNTLVAWRIEFDKVMPQKPVKVNNEPVEEGHKDDNLPF